MLHDIAEVFWHDLLQPLDLLTLFNKLQIVNRLDRIPDNDLDWATNTYAQWLGYSVPSLQATKTTYKNTLKSILDNKISIISMRYDTDDAYKGQPIKLNATEYWKLRERLIIILCSTPAEQEQENGLFKKVDRMLREHTTWDY